MGRSGHICVGPPQEVQDSSGDGGRPNNEEERGGLGYEDDSEDAREGEGGTVRTVAEDRQGA